MRIMLPALLKPGAVLLPAQYCFGRGYHHQLGSWLDRLILERIQMVSGISPSNILTRDIYNSAGSI